MCGELSIGLLIDNRIIDSHACSLHWQKFKLVAPTYNHFSGTKASRRLQFLMH